MEWLVASRFNFSIIPLSGRSFPCVLLWSSASPRRVAETSPTACVQKKPASYCHRASGECLPDSWPRSAHLETFGRYPTHRALLPHRGNPCPLVRSARTTDRHGSMPRGILGTSSLRACTWLWSTGSRHSLHGSRSEHCGMAGPCPLLGASFQRNARPGGNHKHYSVHRYDSNGGSDGTLAALGESPDHESIGNAVRWHPWHDGRVSLEPTLSHQ